MNVIISPIKSDNFILPIEPTATVLSLKETVASKLKVDLHGIHLIYNGDELINSDTLATLENLATIVCVHREEEEGGATEEGSQMVSAQELDKTIIATSIPIAPEEDTEQALLEAFAFAGQFKRIIFQMDEGSSLQNAVIVFESVESANRAIQQDFVEVLGARVPIIAASSLPVGEGEEETGEPSEAVKRVGTFLAGGYLLGQRGVARVKVFDAKHGISLRIKIAAEMAKMKAYQFDEKHRISERVVDLTKRSHEKIKKWDEDLGVSKGAKAGAVAVGRLAKKGADKAMENESIRKGVSRVGGWLSKAKKSVKETYSVAKEEVQAKNRTPGSTETVEPATAPKSE